MVTAHLTSNGDSDRVLRRRSCRAGRPRPRTRDGASRGRPAAPTRVPVRPTGWSGKTQWARADGSAVTEQIQTPGELVGSADGVGRTSQSRHAAQEAVVGFVAVGNRPEALPPVAAQLVQSAVISGAGVGVGGDRLVVGTRRPRPGRPTPPKPRDGRRPQSRASRRPRVRLRRRCRWAAGLGGSEQIRG